MEMPIERERKQMTDWEGGEREGERERGGEENERNESAATSHCTATVQLMRTNQNNARRRIGGEQSERKRKNEWRRKLMNRHTGVTQENQNQQQQRCT